MENEVLEISAEEQNIEVILDDVIEDIGEYAVSDIEEVKVEADEQPSKPATYKGNAYDMTSLIALVCGIVILFLCLTCNAGFYLLPFLAIILGIVGVVMAQKSIDPQRTQLLSWLGIGSGIAVVLISLVGIALYIILIVVVMRMTNYQGY